MPNTTIDAEYLKSEFDFNIKEFLKDKSTSSGNSLKVVFNRIYTDMYIYVKSNNIDISSLADLETLLNTDERKDFYKQAQAYQLIYQLSNGKNSLIIDDNGNSNPQFDTCRDAENIIRHVLGLYKRSMFLE